MITEIAIYPEAVDLRGSVTKASITPFHGPAGDGSGMIVRWGYAEMPGLSAIVRSGR